MAKATPPGKQGFLHLPEELQWHIAQEYGRHGDGSPLMGVSRQMRDLLITNSSVVKLSLQEDQEEESNVAIAARLLRRVCEQGQDGLSLEVKGGEDGIQGPSLPVLLCSALKSGGWNRIHSLEMQFDYEHPNEYLHLLGPAFPNLRSLRIVEPHLGRGGLFAGLRACAHLTALEFVNHWELEDQEVCAALLAGLPSLRSLTWEEDVPLGVLSQVSTLTHLSISTISDGAPLPAEDLIAVAARNPHLQSLHWRAQVDDLTADGLQVLLQSCTSLTSFDSFGAWLSHDEVAVLLKHGQHLKSLSVSRLEVDHSLTDLPCSWDKLELFSAPDVVTLAYLPLQAVRVLNAKHMAGSLLLPLHKVPTQQLPGLLHKAATAIAETQAWQQHQRELLLLQQSDPSQGRVQPSFTAQTRVDLLKALAPLKHLAYQKFWLSGFSCEFQMGGPELAALNASIGNSLESILLGNRGQVTLDTSFWPALLKVFPALKHLGVYAHVRGATTMADLALFCKEAPSWFTLSLCHSVCDAAAHQQLRSILAAWSASHVTIK